MDCLCAVSGNIRTNVLGCIDHNQWLYEAAKAQVQLLGSLGSTSAAQALRVLQREAYSGASRLADVCSEIMARLADTTLRAYCPSLRAGIPLSNVWKELWQYTLRINESIQFSPALASWLFIVASVNVTNPRLLRHLSPNRMVQICGRFIGQLFLPWFLYRYIWIPVNRFFYFLLVDQFGLDASVRTQWLPFLSMFAAILFLIWSLHHTGTYPALFPRNLRHRRSSTTQTAQTSFPKRARSGKMKMTRSGAVYGMY